MKVDMALALAAVVAAGAVTTLGVGGGQAVSSSGSKRKVEATVDDSSRRVTEHKVQKRERVEDPWLDEESDSYTSTIRKCIEEPIRPYLPLCTALMMFDCNSNGILDHHEIHCGAIDSDGDGVLDSCERAVGDFNLDGMIDGMDLCILMANWGVPNPQFGDLNCDGTVDAIDLGILLGRYGVVVF